MAYTSSQIVQAVPTGINSALVCVKAETAFTAVSSVTVDNVFTSSYTNYKIIIRYTSTTTTGNNLDFRLRAGGSSATGSNYNNSAMYADGSTASAFLDNSVSYWRIGQYTNTYNAVTNLDIFAPQLATPTVAINQQAANLGGYTTNRIYCNAFNHTLSTAYDGFELMVTSAGTHTGTYAVYGYGKSV